MKLYEACPLCGGESVEELEVETDRPGPTKTLIWMRCTQCDHSHTKHYWTDEVLPALPTQVAGGQAHDRNRLVWSRTVEKAIALGADGLWVDVGCGDGGLITTAHEFGFDVLGVDAKPQACEALKALGYETVCSMDMPDCDPSVVSLCDVLEHVPFPRKFLQSLRAKVKAGTVFIVSCPNLDSVTWRAWPDEQNPYWYEIEHHHNFTRKSLQKLLRECGFKPESFGVSARYAASMEIVSIAV